MRRNLPAIFILLLFLSIIPVSWGNAQCSSAIQAFGHPGSGPFRFIACNYSNNSISDAHYYLTVFNSNWSVNWSVTGGQIISGQGTNHLVVRWTSCNVPPGSTCNAYINAIVSDGQGCTSNLAMDNWGQPAYLVELAPSLPPAPITGPDTVCVGEPAVFSAWMSYHGWFSTPGSSVIGNSSNLQSYPNGTVVRYYVPGTYTVTGSNASAYDVCVTNTTHSVVVIPSNWGSIISGPSSSCVNDTMLFTVSSSPNTNENWSITNGIILSGQGTDSVEILRTNSDTILVTVLMSKGQCFNEETFTNIEYNSPLIAPEQICYGDTALVISEVPLGFNRTISIIGGTLNSTFGDSLFAIPDSNSSTISITQNLNRIGCILSDSITIDIRQAPTLTLGADTSFCANSPLVLQPQTSYSSYFWSDSTQQDSLTINSSGQYHLTVEDSIGCSASDTIQISQAISPFISISSATGNYVMCQSDSSIAITAISNATTYLWSTGSTGSTINADSAGPYWVEATNLAGCTERETVYISRANVPNPSPIIQPNGPIQLCNGDSIVLDAGSSYYSYLWNTNTTNRFLTVSQPGLYFATVYNGLGCAGESQMVEVLMDTNSSPIITLVYDTLWSTPALTYKWRRNSSYIAGATSQFHIPLPSGTYDVEIQNSSGCTMISNTQTWYAIVGMEEVASNDWTLYPNPNQGNFNLEFKSPVNDIEIFIFDGLGKQIFQRHIQDGPPIKVYPIQLESLSEGVYFVILNYNGDQRAMKKMIIRR